jgi:hypothetical protein
MLHLLTPRINLIVYRRVTAKGYLQDFPQRHQIYSWTRRRRSMEAAKVPMIIFLMKTFSVKNVLAMTVQENT